MKAITIGMSIVLSLALLITSCGKDAGPAGPGTPATPTTYAGTFAGVGESGSLTLTIAASTIISKATASRAVTGSLKPDDAASVSLAGAIGDNDSLAVTGGGYIMAGFLSGGTLQGSYIGPNGPGNFTVESSVNNSVTVYCGQYASLVTPDHGTFNLVRKSSTISGLVTSVSGTPINFNGIIVGDTIKVYQPGSTTLYLAVGTFTNAADTAATGTYDLGDDNGTWQCRPCR